jgi:hypothetical protein
MKFVEEFGKYTCIGDTITLELDDRTITATIEADEHMSAPWVEHDGHGPVSDWTTRDKLPGERIVNAGRGKINRYYDVQEAMEIAKRDGWDAKPFGEGTKGEQAARAVEADFQSLRAWCADEWQWCSIVLSIRCGDWHKDCAASLSGMEMNHPNGDNSYLTEVANELLEEVTEELTIVNHIQNTGCYPING